MCKRKKCFFVGALLVNAPNKYQKWSNKIFFIKKFVEREKNATFAVDSWQTFIC